MTITEKQCVNDNYYVALEIHPKRGNGCYVVQACPRINEHLFGYPIREMVYSMDEKEKAYATYRRYVRKYN